MKDITVCEIDLNGLEANRITLWTQWFEDHFKVVLLPSNNVPLSGEVTTEQIDYFAANDKSCNTRDEYIQKTRNILSGRNSGVYQFSLQNAKFRWTEGMWDRGIVEVTPCNIEEFSKVLEKFLVQYRSMEESVNKLESENIHLKQMYMKLNDSLESISTRKEELERILLQKFLLLINSKKKRIRELEEAAKKRPREDNSIYDTSTDDGESSDVSENAINKNKSANNYIVDSTSTSKIRKLENLCTKTNENAKEKKSRSKEGTSVTNISNLDITEEESEEDLFT
ncbi:uncharacterized protein LOC107262826 isoform X2 [Cephus cinctus]|uniref:Uncharacterized protein LOC107262826 isoform X2 n=1 Tax=Cephus cinctus TaxID=211228 RepID=A0AAJ7FCD7_CEPCN|nr:uncharacterized protein LOC107262826 isoform X2 [Cephus cinctus]